MKIDKFNKLGDTAFRVKNQIPGYAQIINIIIEFYQDKENENKKISEEYYTKKIKEYGLYHYKSKNGPKRYDMVLGFLYKNGLLKKDENNEIDIKHLSKISESVQNTPEKLFCDAFIKNNIVFNKFCDFIFNSSKEKLIWNQLLISFLVYDPKDNKDFSYYYNINDIFDEIANKIIKSNYFKNLELAIKENKISNFRLLRKNSSNKSRNIFEIAKNKFSNKDSTEFLLNIKCTTTTDFFKKIYLRAKGLKSERDKLKIIEFINSLSYDLFLYFIIYQKEVDLFKDYIDLNKRWFRDLNLYIGELLEVKSFKNHFSIKDNFLVYNYVKEKLKYFYDIKQINSLLHKISNYNNQNNKIFDEIKIERKELKNATNPSISEYFVNLKAAILLKIEANKFKDSSRTLVTNDLIPYFHAPGGGADFESEYMGLMIESSIINKEESFKEREIFSNIRHFLKKIDEWGKKVICYVIHLDLINNDYLQDLYNKLFTAEAKNKGIELHDSKIICMPFSEFASLNEFSSEDTY